MADLTDRSFEAGSTVLLTMRLSKPGLRTPLDADAAQVLDIVDDDGASSDFDFPLDMERIAEGIYQTDIETVAMSPGVYRWLGRASIDGKHVVKTGVFVLKAPLDVD